MKPLVSLLVSVGLATGCTSPSSEDEYRLRSLEQKFGAQYQFALAGCCYLEAALRKGARYSEDQAREIAGLFVVAGSARRDTAYQYVNFFDAEGRFIHQMFYNSATHALEKSATPHY
jgi:hypothetical protein